MAVKVILRQTIANLGRPGDIVSVKPGYAHNYLIPQKFAYPYSDGNLKRLEHEKKALAAREAKLFEDAVALKEQFAGKDLVFVKKCSIEGVLYGSVTPAEVAIAITAKGLEVDKKNVMIDEAIKRIGNFEARIRLHPEVVLEFAIIVKSEDGLAEAHMAEKAGASTATPAEPVEAADEAEQTEEEATEEEVTEEVAEESVEEEKAE